MMKKIQYCLFLLLFCCSSAQGNDIVIALDRDHDDLVSREEAAILPLLIKNFDHLDANFDKQLSANEILAFRLNDCVR